MVVSTKMCKKFHFSKCWEAFLLMQSELLQQLCISHSVLSFSAVTYKQYMWRFSWESKWQQQIFLWDFMKSLGLFLFMAHPEKSERRRRCNFCFLKGHGLLFHSHRSLQEGNMLMTPSHFFIWNAKWKQAFGVWLQQRSDCLNCFSMNMRALISPQDGVNATICSRASPSSSALEYKEGPSIFGPPFPAFF